MWAFDGQKYYQGLAADFGGGTIDTDQLYLFAKCCLAQLCSVLNIFSNKHGWEPQRARMRSDCCIRVLNFTDFLLCVAKPNFEEAHCIQLDASFQGVILRIELVCLRRW
jgi:hypothetical protein